MATNCGPGDVVLKSECYAHVISPEARSNVCDNCLTSVNIFDHLPPVTLYRCSKCKLSYYCDVTCQRKAWPEHRRECKYLKNNQPKVPPNIVRLILRACFKQNEQPDIKECLPNGSSRSFTDLMMHKQEISKDNVKNEAFSSFLFVLLKCVGNTYSTDHLFETYCRILINSTEITDCMGNVIGTGIYLGLSAVDHSCRPNVNVLFNGKTVELIALDNIQSPAFQFTRVNYNTKVLPRSLRRKKTKR